LSTITSITPKRISPVTTGTLTISGTGLDTVTSVTVDGRAAPIVAQSATSITCTWPKRVTNGVWDWSGGSVVVALAGPSPAAGVVSYMSTRDGRGVLSVNARLAAASVLNGYFYDWSAAQITGFQVDPATWMTGSRWPRVVSYITSMDPDPSSFVSGFRTFDVRCRLDAVVPMKSLADATQEGSLILSDLTRAVMLDVSCGGIADVVTVDAKELMVIEGLAAGSLLGAGIGYTMKIQHIENDPTQNVEWFSTGGI
jgi:hypothetical protein